MRTKRTLKDIAKVSAATMGSRVLGLVRDQLTFAVLGASALSSAFLFAFALPNLFRRLLGEGALTSAMMPVLANTLKDGGKDAAFALLNRVLSRAGAVLLAIAAAGILLSIAGAEIFRGDYRLFWSGAFSAILFPYIILICLAAVFCGALNTLGIFGIPSVGPMLLNAAMIASLAVGWLFWGQENIYTTLLLCGGVLVGGAAQLFLPLFYLRSKGWRFKADFSSSAELSELMRLFTPALLGASIIQINLMISKFLANSINDTALPGLYIADRLVELPLGIFTFAIITVYFPKLSKLGADNSPKTYMAEYRRGLISMAAVTVPAAAGLIALSEDIIAVLFEWGAFGGADVAMCAPILSISAMGIPVFSLAAFATKGFHSCKDTKTPVKVSVVSFALNVALSFGLMGPFGARGLAAAGVLSALVPATVLSEVFRRRKGSSGAWKELLKCVFAAVAMYCALIVAKDITALLVHGKALAFLNCALLIPAGAGIYALALKILAFEQMDDLVKLFIRR